ncbi:hypothetical protein D3C77_710530 [compost metagenome]
MHTALVLAEGQKGRLQQQRVEVDVRVFADQLEVEAEGRTDGLAAGEGEDLEVAGGAGNRQGENDRLGGGHP